LDSNVATVSITVDPMNDAPVAQGGSASGNEDTPISGQIVATDVDNSADQLSYNVVSGPTHGTLALNAHGSFPYTPNANFNGSDSFSYKAYDGSLYSNIAAVQLTVNPVNDAPVAQNGSARGERGHAHQRTGRRHRRRQQRRSAQLQRGLRPGPWHADAQQSGLVHLLAERQLQRLGQLQLQGLRRQPLQQHRRSPANGEPGDRRAGGGLELRRMPDEFINQRGCCRWRAGTHQ